MAVWPCDSEILKTPALPIWGSSLSLTGFPATLHTGTQAHRHTGTQAHRHKGYRYTGTSTDTRAYRHTGTYTHRHTRNTHRKVRHTI